ncbi:hypothetical protein H5410_027941 [Solanum commersonii]|uniref:Uncharacterized protein n=1 Tax=Solanum commersonii TaxID=4109 RepID=A0A9J5Z0L3_SOLCO|nr:hypothetical protein H5410_027941 [Solanum commersonii]
MCHCLWMYNINYETVGGMKPEFLICTKTCMKSFNSDTIMVHLYCNEIKSIYFDEDDRFQHNTFQHDRIHEMVNDVFGVPGGMEPKQYFYEAFNEETRCFHQQLEEANCPLCKGSLHSVLSVPVRLMNIKLDWSIPHVTMDSMIDLFGKTGLSYDRIHYCVSGCMLFYKTDSKLENCKFCGYTHYKLTLGGNPS